MEVFMRIADLVRGELVVWRIARMESVVFTVFEPFGQDWTGVVLCHRKDRFPMGAKKSERNGALTFAQKLLQRQKDAEGSSYVASDEELAAAYPHVAELLTVKLVDDKHVIEPASLTVYCRTGSFHACLKHKGLDLAWWGEGPTFKRVLEALEASVGKEEGQEASRQT